MRKTSLAFGYTRFIEPIYRPIYRSLDNTDRIYMCVCVCQDDTAISPYITRPSEHLSRWEPKPHWLLDFFSTDLRGSRFEDPESRARHADRHRRRTRSTRWNGRRWRGHSFFILRSSRGKVGSGAGKRGGPTRKKKKERVERERHPGCVPTVKICLALRRSNSVW